MQKVGHNSVPDIHVVILISQIYTASVVSFSSDFGFYYSPLSQIFSKDSSLHQVKWIVANPLINVLLFNIPFDFFC